MFSDYMDGISNGIDFLLLPKGFHINFDGRDGIDYNIRLEAEDLAFRAHGVIAAITNGTPMA